MELNADLTSKTVPVFQGMPYLAGRVSKLLHMSSQRDFGDDAPTKSGLNPRFHWETKKYVSLAAMCVVTPPQNNQGHCT